MKNIETREGLNSLQLDWGTIGKRSKVRGLEVPAV